MTDLRPEDLAAHWESVMDIEAVQLQVADVQDLYPDRRSITIAFADLDSYNPDFAAFTLDRPDDSLTAARSELARLSQHQDVDVRITDLPGDAAVEISKLRACHVGKLISVGGLLNKATAVKPEIRVGVFKCMRCPAIIREPQTGSNLTEPMECYKDQEGCGRTSGSTKFRLITERCELTDAQRVELQELPGGLRGGTQPGRITALLSHEITGKLTSGMRVTLNGILRLRPDKGKSVIGEMELEVVSYQVDEGDVDERRLSDEDLAAIRAMAADKGLIPNMIMSVAPGIQGYEKEKLALLCQQVGGVASSLDDGQKHRGDVHILLIGDPGVAKSQLILYMVGLATRGVYVSGKASTAAGLTAAAVKDDEFGDGRWVLEAGAMVLADRGLCGIDEMNMMDDKNRSAMYEAMESQRVSVAKAGITASLLCRTSVLGGANPKYGRFDDAVSIAEQIDLPSALLSRFDLIFPILDRPDKAKDRSIAKHIGKGRQRGGALKHRHDGDAVADAILAGTEDLKPIYDRETMRRYLSYARSQSPILTDKALEAMVDHYVSIRQMGGGENHSVAITPRQMEAAVRLSEALAKLRLSPYVEVEDAKRSVDIVMHYLRAVTLSEDGPDADLITGTPGRKRYRLLTVEAMIKERKEFTEAQIIEECKGKGIVESEVREVIERMIKDNRLYNPRRDELKVIG